MHEAEMQECTISPKKELFVQKQNTPIITTAAVHRNEPRSRVGGQKALKVYLFGPAFGFPLSWVFFFWWTC